MIAPNETKLVYRETTIRIVSQQKTVSIHWESSLDGSIGNLQVSRTHWADGELARLAMETIDRCYKQYRRTKQQR